MKEHDETTEQKFKRGDVVRIAKDLGPSMSHFQADKDAIVLGSYRELCGGGNGNSYNVMFCDTGSECAWYEEWQLEFLRHGGLEEIEKVIKAREEREKSETDLEWIVTNWLDIREKPPGATMGELMRRVGISNPWGGRGEGITYYSNAMATFQLLDEVLSTGDVAKVEEAFRQATQPRAV